MNSSTKLAEMQARIDEWAWRNFDGEIVFHLVAAEYTLGKIPSEELRIALDNRRAKPLTGALQPKGAWSTVEFFQASGRGAGRCDACGMTRTLTETTEGELVCKECSLDEVLGQKLTRASFVRIFGGEGGDVSALGLSMNLSEVEAKLAGDWLPLDASTGGRSWRLLRHLPSDSGKTLDFDDLARVCTGPHKLLGYLRIDVDHAGKSFGRLSGDPLKTWALSRLLNGFFAGRANDLLTKEYRNVYAVYGGGDDLFVIGPWPDTLDFAIQLRQDLRQIVGESLTFSAGLSMAKPREHILTQAALAGEVLDDWAKGKMSYGRECGRDQIYALGALADWKTFETLLRTAKSVTGWLESGELPFGFLRQVLQLHNAWKLARTSCRNPARAPLFRHLPLLNYQIHRNLKAGPAQEWASSLLGKSTQWPWVDFVVRYAMLAARRGQGEN